MKKLAIVLFVLAHAVSLASTDPVIPKLPSVRSVAHPIITVTPQPLDPGVIEGYVTCFNGNMNWVGDCVTIAVYCSNNINYLVVVCPEKKYIVGLARELAQEDGTFPSTTTNMDIDISVSFPEDSPINEMSAEERAVVLSQINNSIIEISENMVKETENYTMTLKAGVYKVVNSKMKTQISFQ